MVTPFTKELTIDEPAAERMVDRLASHGLGAFVLGTTGEAASIPNASRNRLVDVAVNAAAGRVPVYAGIGDNCVLNSIETASDYLDLGVDAVVAPLPAYYSLTETEMLEFYELLSKQISGDIVPYNIPQATHMSIPVEVVKRFSDWENIVGFKDSENAPGRLEQVAKLGGRADFSIFMGVARLSLDAVKANYDGLVPSSGNIAPEIWAEFAKLTQELDWDAAGDVQSKLNNIAFIFQKNRTLGQSIAALKACVSNLGLCQPYVLPPLKTLELCEIYPLKEELELHVDIPSAFTKGPK